MQKKKNDKANLEKKRFVFFQIGMVMALGVTLMAFEWTSFKEDAQPLRTGEIVEIYDPIPPVYIQPKPKPPQPERVINRDLPPVIGEPTPPDPTPVVPVDPRPVIVFDTTDYSVPEIIEPTGPFMIVEDMPFWDCDEARKLPSTDKGRAKRDALTERKILGFLSNNVKYPRMCVEAGISGTVYVTYIVDVDGSITGVEIARGVHKLLDDEAMRVVKKLPKYVPGKQRNQAVPVRYNLPIKFTLN